MKEDDAPKIPDEAQMAVCHHEPLIHFNTIFTTSGRMFCKHCHAPLILRKNWLTLSRGLYFLFIAYIIFSVLDNRNTDKSRMWINLAVLFGIILLFLLLNFLLLRFAPKEVDAAMVESLRGREEREHTANEEKAAETQAMTEEQAELAALYKKYERLNAEAEAGSRSETDDETARIADGGESASGEKKESPSEKENGIACEHRRLKKDWRNYLPGTSTFVCADCGRALRLPELLKKRLNLVFLLGVLALFIPFTNWSMPFWQFILITLAVAGVMALIQYIAIKRCKLEEA